MMKGVTSTKEKLGKAENVFRAVKIILRTIPYLDCQHTLWLQQRSMFNAWDGRLSSSFSTDNHKNPLCEELWKGKRSDWTLRNMLRASRQSTVDIVCIKLRKGWKSSHISKHLNGLSEGSGRAAGSDFNGIDDILVEVQIYTQMQ